MRVLMVAARDSTNFAMSKLAKELKNRGHEVLIYDKNLDNINVRMFQKLGLTVNYYDELTEEIVNGCDIMFAHTTYIRDKKIKKKLYTFFFNHIFVYGHENASDFVFTQCDDPYNTFPNKVVMKIGSPKLDHVFQEIVPAKESKRILFIETGHFPFGERGRTQVAQLILDMCKKCPDYTITVKPRFMLEDTKNVTRKNTDHIYKYIDKMCDGKIPPNLELLHKHYSLEEFIYQSHSIVCYGTSSYLEASLSGRGVIYIPDIESMDAVGDRQNKYWKAFNEFIKDTGVLVPYDNVLDYLPDGIPCSEKHLNKAIYSRENVVPKIVDVVEYVWNTFLSKGQYLANGHYEYNTYVDELRCDKDLTEQKLIENNTYDVLTYDIQKAMQALGADLSFEKVYNVLNEWKETMDFSEREKSALRKKLDEVISNYIVDNHEFLMENKIDQSILIQKYYELGKYDEIEKMNCDSLLAKDAYYYFMGMHYCDWLDSRGPEYIAKYTSFLKKISFEESEIYMPEQLIKAFNSVYIYYCRMNDLAQQKMCIEQMEELAEKYQYNVLNYEMRCARLCQKQNLLEGVKLLAKHWLKRDHSGFQKYRELELNAEAYKLLANIYGLDGDAVRAEECDKNAKRSHAEKIALIS